LVFYFGALVKYNTFAGIQYKVLSGIWKPLQVSKGDPQLSDILFADVMLFCEASTE